MSDLLIQPEQIRDVAEIRNVVSAAFAGVARSNQKECLLVDQLRDGAALSVSLVAQVDSLVVGHIAFSPVTIDGLLCDWFGLAPLAVRPDCQRAGIGSRLVNAGLDSLRRLEAKGCVVLGEPEYYRRFGFVSRQDLLLANAPAKYFLAQALTGEVPRGHVAYHQAFALFS